MFEWDTKERFFLAIDGVNLEASCFGAPPSEAPTIIILHEGLGCVELWKDFPSHLAEATGCGVFAYSRRGYGKSDEAILPRLTSYMHDEAKDVLPQVLEVIGVEQGIILGHSDGGSIASIYMGNTPSLNIVGLCLLAPHFFTEPVCLESIAQVRASFECSSLEKRLQKYHNNAKHTFLGWADVWLDPHFVKWNIEDYTQNIKNPTLVIQGKQDQYGTTAQITSLQKNIQAPLTTVMINECKHSPHLEKEKEVLEAIVRFVREVV